MIRYCLKCGESVERKTEGNFLRYVCPSCGFVNFQNPKPCVTAVIVRDEKVLLTRRSIEPGLGKWDLPGGFMEKGEHPHDALKREIHEELGVDLSSYKLLDFFMDEYGDGGDSTLNIAFICQIEKDPWINDHTEFDEIRWFDFNNIPGAVAFQNVTDILEAYQRLVSRMQDFAP